MSLRSTPWPAGTPCWAELAVADLDAAVGFYEATLGWDFDPPSEALGGYRMARRSGAPAAAVGADPRAGTKDRRPGHAEWTLYFSSDDIDYTAFAVTAAGGTLLLAPTPLGAAGRLMIASDPSGAPFGAWEAGDHIGAGVVNEPGGLAWEDLRSSEPDRARQFYKAVFGFQTTSLEMSGPDYCVFSRPGEDIPLGGMGATMSDPGGSHWLVYFGVADADTTAERVLDAGGAVHRAAFDTPFGRMVELSDPAGSVFMGVENTGQAQPDRSQ